ncbi:HU family DNA-binding protein [Rhodococcus sp. IEGM 1408]|uniref:HU family DNA-binding protein n=1 Tax=Rhodococcus sp. IEGM 1408 TaxID=3082220 RepID=UPI002955C2AA|nr:HU family DNA-binding protein [Rhodococcus sp. IEGM 1408]MDV8000494.1 HU family DNA-binding protein [Rhodococcus sp. IEGM 1408]
MNKADLIAELADRMGGDHQLATEALENTLDIIVRTVASGESITIMGFGIFEKRRRAARVARNPHTGESIPVPPTYSPAFRPGQYFKSVIQGSEPLPEGRLAAKRSSSHQAFGGLRNGVAQHDKVS